MFRGLCLTFGKEIWRVTKRHKTHFYREVGIETDGRDTGRGCKRGSDEILAGHLGDMQDQELCER